jgi:hypothetical protein
VESQAGSGFVPLAGGPAPGKTPAGPGRPDGSLGRFLSGLLVATCRLGPAQAGAALRAGDGNRIDVLALHPHPGSGGPAEGPPAWLSRAAQSAHESMQANRPVAAPWSEPEVSKREQPPSEIPDDQGPPQRKRSRSRASDKRHVLALPLKVGELSLAAAFLIEARTEAALQAIRERLELGVSLLALAESRQDSQKKELDLQRLRRAMETLAAVNCHRRFGSTAMALCNEASAQWRCDRVSLGVLKGRYVQVKALSHTESFSRKMQVVQDLEAAMEECLDQDCEVIHPAAPDSIYISRQTAQLSQRHGPLAIASLPIRYGGKVWGVLTLERPADRPFVVEEVEAVRLALELCTTRLAALHEQDRWIGAKLAGGLRDVLALAVGPRHTWAKLVTLLIVAAAVFLIFARGNYRAQA